jgi:hypothetical protein
MERLAMAGITRIGFVIILGFGLCAGCSKGTSSEAASATGNSQKGVQANAASNPVAQAASEWLDAVLKGDTQRASAWLTPQAVKQIVSGKTFSPPGVDNPSYQIGEVRTPSQDQAIVQCVLNYTAEGKQQSEEMCCLLKRIESNWRVSGIAYGTAPDKPWTLSDFETGQDIPIPRQAMSNSSPGMANSNAGRPSPPRTAQEAPVASPTGEFR